MHPTTAFLESFVNVSHTVMGLRLKPLCLRHWLYLYAVESPLVITSKEIERADVEIAAKICSSEPDQTLEEILNVRGLSKWKLARWKRRNRKRDLRAEVNAFFAYQDDYLALPEFYEKQEKVEPKLPWLLMHAAALIKNTGWNATEVFNMPIGQLLWFNLAFSYLATGETNVLGEQDLAAQKALEALTEGGGK